MPRQNFKPVLTKRFGSLDKAFSTMYNTLQYQNTSMRISSFTMVYRDLLDGAKQKPEKSELASELLAEMKRDHPGPKLG